MSVTTVVELSHELHRLAIAGVGLAKGDRRVAALLPALERSGEKVAVFARIGERTRALLDAPKGAAAAEFLALNTLVGAVLKTQGRSGVDGELAPLPPSATSPKRVPARALAELRDGLHGDGAALRNALERGWFGDARLAPMALDALRSDNAVVANLAARELVPPYGRGIVPLLVASLDLTLKRPASRLIETVRRVDADSGAALARQILDPAAERVFELDTDGIAISDEARAAAIECLGDGRTDAALLADFVGAKRKALRIAALSRLLALGDAGAEARAVAMMDVSSGKSREAIEAIPFLSGEALTERVFARGAELAAALAAKEPSVADVTEAAGVLSLIARSDPAVERFDEVFAQLKALGKVARSFGRSLTRGAIGDGIDCLVGLCPDDKVKGLLRFAMARDASRVVRAAIRHRGPERALSFLRQGNAKRLGTGLRRAFDPYPDEYVPGASEPLPSPSEWGAEWLELALEHAAGGLAAYLWTLDPDKVAGRMLKSDRLSVEEALTVLLADPGRAAELPGRLAPSPFDYSYEEEHGDHALVRSLCEAIAKGDRVRSLTLSDGLPCRYGWHRLETLRARLNDHLSESAA